MEKYRVKKYFVLIVIVLLFGAIIGINRISKIDFNAGKIKIAKVYLENVTSKLNANIYDITEDNKVISNGYDEIEYSIRYSLTREDGIDTRPVIIKASLGVSEEYAIFKSLDGTGITSSILDDGKTIEVRVENARCDIENELTLKMLINGAPNGYKVTPKIEIKEVSQDNFNNVFAKEVEVRTNTISGIVRDEKNAIVKDVLVSLIKNGEIIKETYSKEDGSYIFSDIDKGKYKVVINEEIFEQMTNEEIDLENTAICNISIRQVEPYEISTSKYITKINLVNNGKTYNYNYGELTLVNQSIRQLKKLSGEIFYKVVVENVGTKEGIIALIKDEIPEGLSFNKNKNAGWEEKNGILYNRSLEGLTLKSKESKNVELVLDIDSTNEARTYLNKVTAYGDVYEKVVYILDGNIIKEEEVLEGEQIKELVVGSNDFSGWYTDKKYTNKYNFNNQVTKDLILYGKSNNEYLVEYYDILDDSYQKIKEETVIENEVVNKTPIVSKQYYTFKYWSLEPNGVEFDLSTKIKNNIKLYAIYQRNTNNVRFYDIDPDGGLEPVLIETQIILQGSKSIEPTSIPTHYGYTFNCFKTEEGNVFDFNSIIEEDTNLRTSYTKNTYTVQYYDNNELKLEDEYEYKDTIDITNTPIVTKEGYTFTFWSLKNETNSYDFTIPVTKNIKLYSNYEIIQNDVIFNDENRVTIVPVDYGLTVSSINNKGKEGHTFKYWSLDRENAFDFNTQIKQSTTLYAVYEKNIYTVTFNDKNPSTNEGTLFTTKSVKYGDKVILEENPLHLGYTFKNWLDENNNIFDFDSSITNNITLTSNYNIIEYDITYDLGYDYLDLGNPTKYTIEDEFTLNNPSNEALKISGVNFIGWLGTNLNEITNEVTVLKGNTGNRNYIANYENNIYTVRFIDKGNQYVVNQSVVHGEKAIRPSIDPSYNYEIFKYWSLEEDGDEYNFDTPVTDNITLYSVYEVVLSPEVSHTPTVWTNQNVTVTIEEKEGYLYKYKVDDSIYANYTGSFEVEENGNVVAYGIKNNVESRITVHEISNIDKIAPTVDEVFIDTELEDGFTLDFVASDDLSGVNKVKLYIKNNSLETDYSYIGDAIYDSSLSAASYDITNLNLNDNYSVKLVAIDNAGNSSVPAYFEYTVVYTDIVARIISINGNDLNEQDYINYSTLRGAIEDEHCISNSCVIQMVKGTNESVEVLNGQNITIDINGKTISGIRDDYTILNNGDLTILDNGVREGVIVNLYGISIKGLASSTFTLGDTSSELSKTSPYILGKTYGLYNDSNADFYFYDGKIEGIIAIQGLVTDTRYAHNIHNSSRSGNQIATLSKVSDPEAKIVNYYYSRLVGALNASTSGSSSDDITSEIDLLKSFDTKGIYGFEYNEETNSLESTNNIIGTTARTTLTIDLTDYDDDQMLVIYSEVLGEGTGKIIISDSKINSNYQGNELSKENIFHLSKGKKAYIDIYYTAKRGTNDDINSTTTNSKFIITKATLTPKKMSDDSNYEIVSSSMIDYSFDYDSVTGQLKSNNQYISNSVAYKSIEIDLRKAINPKDVLVNAYIDTYLNSDFYAYIMISETNEKYYYINNASNYSDNHDKIIGYITKPSSLEEYGKIGPYNFSKTLSPGKIYYLQVYYIKRGGQLESEYVENDCKDQFVINSIDIVDSIMSESIDINSSMVTTTINGEEYKYIPINLTNRNDINSVEIRTNYGSNDFTDYYAFVTTDIESVSNNDLSNVKMIFKDDIENSSYKRYYYGNLEPGKINYLFFHKVTASGLSQINLSSAKSVDLDNLTVARGSSYTNNKNEKKTYYSNTAYGLKDYTTYDDSYIKLNLNNESYDQYLRIEAMLRNDIINCIYLSDSAEAIPIDEINENSSSTLVKYNNNDLSKSIGYATYDHTYTDSYLSSDQFFSYIADFNYKLKKGKTYYLHFAQKKSSYSSDYSRGIEIANVLLSSVGAPVIYDLSNIINELVDSSDVTSNNSNELTNYVDNNYRYIGSEPNNYIKFNNELWRIVGVFETEDESGNKANRLKIVRDEFVGTGVFDVSNSDINDGYGVNEWSQADLMKVLNPGFENNKEQIPLLSEKYSHTSNISDNGTKNYDYGNNWTNANISGTDRGDTSQAHVITIPGATRLHVKIIYGGESSSWDWVSMWTGSHPDYTASENYSTSITGRLGGGENQVWEQDIDGDTVTFAFKSDGSGIGNGYGYYAVVTNPDSSISEYEEKIINNSLYWNKTSGNCTNKQGNYYGSCDYSETGLTKEARDMIDKVKWYTGSMNYTDYSIPVHDLYNYERSNYTGKDGLTTEAFPTLDNIDRTTSWYGYVGLLSPSDIYMASDDNETSHLTREQCLSSTSTSGGCFHAGNSSNWLGKYGSIISGGAPYWLMNPSNRSPYIEAAYIGSISYYTTNTSVFYIKPAVYLSTKTYIVDGIGTKELPYKIELGTVDNPDEYYSLFNNTTYETGDENINKNTYIDNSNAGETTIYGFDYNSETGYYVNNNEKNDSIALKTIKYDLTNSTNTIYKKLTMNMIYDNNDNYIYKNGMNYYSWINYFLFKDEITDVPYNNTSDYSYLCNSYKGDWCNSEHYISGYKSGSEGYEFTLTLEPGHVYYLQLAFVKRTNADMIYKIEDYDNENTTTSFEKYTVVNSLNEEYDEITLLKNIYIDEPITIDSDKKVVIDLNGYQLSSTNSSSTPVIINNGDLSIVNRNQSSSGTISLINNNYGGKLTLNNSNVNVVNNYGEFKGESSSTVTTFNDENTGNILDGEGIFNYLVINTDVSDIFSGYNVTQSIEVNTIATMDSINNNISYSPSVTVSDKGILTLSNSRTGRITNNGKITLNNINATIFNNSVSKNEKSVVNNLTLSDTMNVKHTRGELEVYNSTIPTLKMYNTTTPINVNSGYTYIEKTNITSATFGHSEHLTNNYFDSDADYFTADIKDSNITNSLTIYLGRINFDNVNLNSITDYCGDFSVKNSTVTGNITESLNNRYYALFPTNAKLKSIEVDIENTIVTENIKLIYADAIINSVTANDLYLRAGTLSSNDSTFKNIHNEHYYSSSDGYYYYRGASMAFNNLVINGGRIYNNNNLTINGATINNSSSNSTGNAIVNYKGSYWNINETRRPGYRYVYSGPTTNIEPNLTLKGNITFNGYTDAIMNGALNDQNSNVGSITIGEKDNENNINTVISGSDTIIHMYGYAGQDINIYDGKLIGAVNKTIITTGSTRINDIENGYDIKTENNGTNQTISLVKVSDILEGAVARIGQTDYPTLNAAFNSINNNELNEIVLLEDITTAAKINIPENENIILNYNGHKIDFIGTYEFINNNGYLKVFDSSINPKISNTWSKKLFLNNGTLEYENVIYNGYSPSMTKALFITGYKPYSPKIISNNSSATIRSGAFSGGSYYGLIGNNTNGNLIVNNGSLKTINNNGTLEVHGGSFTSTVGNYSDLKFYNNGTLLLDGGTYSNESEFIENKGIASIDSISYGNSVFASVNDGSMILSNNSISGTITSSGVLTINSGTHSGKITTSGTLNINDINLTTSNDAIVGNGANINIVSGKIVSSGIAINCSSGACNTVIGTKGDIDEQNNQIVSKTNPDISGTSYVYLPSNSESKIYFYDGILRGSFNSSFDEIEDNYYLIIDGTTRYLDRLPVVENVSRTETTQYYDIQSAIDDVNNGEKIVLLRQYEKIATIPTFVVDSSKNFTFDLNGYGISGGNEEFLDNKGTLRLINSSDNISVFGTIRNSGNLTMQGKINMTIIAGGLGVINESTGSANIEDLTINIPKGSQYSDPPMDCRSVLPQIVNDGVMTVNNLTIDSGIGCQAIDNNNELTINSSTITQNYSQQATQRYYNYRDGTNEKRNSSYSNYGISDNFITNNGTMKMNNVTISRTGVLKENVEEFFYHSLINSDGIIEITGGSYITPNDVFLTSSGKATVDQVNVSNGKDTFRYSGELTVNDSTIDTNSNIFKSLGLSKLTINDGTYTTSGNRQYQLYDNNDGKVYNTSSKYHISSQGEGEVIINGGTFTNSNYGGFYAKHGTNNNSKLKITKGIINITSKEGAATYNVDELILGEKDGIVKDNDIKLTTKEVVLYDTKNLYFYDGKLTNSNDYLLIGSSSASFDRTIETENNYQILGGSNTRYVGQDNIIVNTNSNTSYQNVQQAINEAGYGNKLQFVKGVYLTSDLEIPALKSIIIDLNGNAVQKSITNKGILEIIDSSRLVNNNYNITDSYNGYIERIINEGTLTVTSGRVDLISNRESKVVNVNDAYIHNTWNSGTINIDGATYHTLYNYSTGTLVSQNANHTFIINEGGNAIINSGNITNLKNNSGTVTIEGGTYYNSGDNYAITNNSEIIINTGNINSKYAIDNNENGVITINGGTYNSNNLLIDNEGIININNITINTSGRVWNSGTINFNHVTYKNSSNYGINCKYQYERYYGYKEVCYNVGIINASDSDISDITSSSVNINNSTLDNVSISNSSSSQDNVLISNVVDGEINGIRGTITNNVFNSKIYAYPISNNSISGNTFNGYTYITSQYSTVTVNSNIINGELYLNPYQNKDIVLDNNVINNTVTINGYGKVNIISGTIEATNEYAVIIKNAILTIGENDGNINKVSPLIKGQKGINNTGTFNFYDGVIISDYDKEPIVGSVITPNGYTVSVVNYVEENVRKATLGIQGQEEARIAVVNKINFESIQDAVNYSVSNGALPITLYADITLESDLIVNEDVTITIYLNGHNILNPDNYNISDKIELNSEIVDDSLGASISKFFASILGNENTKDVIIYEMDNGQKLSPERIYHLYKYENGKYTIVNMEKEELGRYTMGDNVDEMTTVRSRLYLNKLSIGNYKLVDDNNSELNFNISEDGISNNIRENDGNNSYGRKISSAIATVIISIQTGGYAPRIFIIIVFVLITTLALYFVRNKAIKCKK